VKLVELLSGCDGRGVERLSHRHDWHMKAQHHVVYVAHRFGHARLVDRQSGLPLLTQGVEFATDACQCVCELAVDLWVVRWVRAFAGRRAGSGTVGIRPGAAHDTSRFFAHSFKTAPRAARGPAGLEEPAGSVTPDEGFRRAVPGARDEQCDQY
jgi:hypothetical protein